ncbi:PIR Superfamily Protein [Plasmodium ovale curtisi]|uniref:PIR Superfamily Protein n=1 Tax=Plasmodium ovale curtisi TaxID=864141 RepID=A0A1A8VNK0_PLAOA|nr:PIR Superfamily Protein [Plasmodium ovale curtisi]
MSSTEPDIYSFFKAFKTYKSYEYNIEENFGKDERKNICTYFSPNVQISSNENANEICEKFKSLYKLIISINKKSINEELYDIDFAFLNYWLNGKLRSTMISHNLSVDKFQEEMSYREFEFVGTTFDKKLYDIKNEDFNNMVLLSDLYDNIAQIFYDTKALDDKKISCIKYFQKFINTYKKGIVKCPHDNTSFCKALKHFKKDYEQKFLGVHSISEKCVDKENLLLPTYDDLSLEKNNTIVGSILGPSFATLITSFFLYKFTPLGQWIRTKMGSTKEAQNNLYDENNQLFLDTSDNKHTNFDEIPYSISYDSSVIS